MRTTMRNVVLAAGAILVCAGGTAQASTLVEANVPFPFVVNGKNFPAGRYVVQRDDMSSSVVLIHGENDNHASTFVLTMHDERQDPAGSRPALTFKRYENQYRLATIWEPGNDGRDVIAR